MPILAIALSLIVGFSIGLIGVGGIFLTPILILTTDLGISAAMGTALSTFIATGLLGTYVYNKEGSINWHYVIYLAPASVIGAVIGSNLNISISEEVLELILAIFLITMAILIFIKKAGSEVEIKGKRDFNKVAYLLIGLLSGLASGLFGVGGPVLMVPILSFLGWPILIAVGVSQVISVFSAFAGSVTYFLNGKIDIPLALIILIVESIGVYCGGSLAHKINKRYLTLFLSLILLILGIYFLI